MRASLIHQLRAAYSGVSRCSPQNFDRLKATLRQLNNTELLQLRDARIRFVSTAANSLLVDRGALPKSARWDRFVEVVVDGLIESHAPAQATA